jgi:DNA-binding CsgD family transcriptional regulator/PAS domain-containing protein
MDELASFSGLIGDIYDATLDLALWPGVLKRISCFVPGSATTLESKDAVNNAVNVFYQDGSIPPEMTRLYNDRYGKLDPCATDHYLAPVGEPRATADIMPYDEFVRSRIYRELLRPYGWVDAATTALDRSGASIASVTVFRDARDGLIDKEARQRLRVLAPHLRRAVLIGKVIEFKSAEAANLADAFDELTAAVLLINADGRIVHANRRALCLLETGDPLSARDGKLFARDPETSRGLQAVFASADKGDAPLGVGGIALPLNTQDGRRFVGHALPLTRGARRRAGRVYAAVAALFVHEAAFPVPSTPELIAKAYGLTPPELRVMLAVVEVGGAPEVAEMLGIAASTVRTHLGRIYEKTGAFRQADLVKLVAGFAIPQIS